MRIEQMRSGRVYLGKRTPASGIAIVEAGELQNAFFPAPEPGPQVETHPQVESELDENEWSVVSFSGVEAGGLTYSQAARLMDILGDNDIHGLCILTDVAAMRI